MSAIFRARGHDLIWRSRLEAAAFQSVISKYTSRSKLYRA